MSTCSHDDYDHFHIYIWMFLLGLVVLTNYRRIDNLHDRIFNLEMENMTLKSDLTVLQYKVDRSK
jgi:hypothetical protein